jgi:anti-sigma factor RsiW
MKGSREVAGLWCHEVLEQLSDYLDGDLLADRRAQVDAHLAGCDVCERFGGEVSQTVTALKQGVGEATEETASDAERHVRLRTKLLSSL